MMCENAQGKKHWLEMFESALYPRQRRGSLLYTNSDRLSASPSSINDKSPVQQQQQQPFEEDFYSDDWITNTQENLTILLAERNFDEALALILRARKHVREFLAEHSQQTTQFVDEYVKNVQIKEQELCKLIEKEIQNICERGCSTNLLKHYYHHIQTLKQLGYVPKAW
jgi:transcriptional accessory protein Tex/SPT6